MVGRRLQACRQTVASVSQACRQGVASVSAAGASDAVGRGFQASRTAVGSLVGRIVLPNIAAKGLIKNGYASFSAFFFHIFCLELCALRLGIGRSVGLVRACVLGRRRRACLLAGASTRGEAREEGRAQRGRSARRARRRAMAAMPTSREKRSGETQRADRQRLKRRGLKARGRSEAKQGWRSLPAPKPGPEA